MGRCSDRLVVSTSFSPHFVVGRGKVRVRLFAGSVACGSLWPYATASLAERSYFSVLERRLGHFVCSIATLRSMLVIWELARGLQPIAFGSAAQRMIAASALQQQSLSFILAWWVA